MLSGVVSISLSIPRCNVKLEPKYIDSIKKAKNTIKQKQIKATLRETTSIDQVIPRFPIQYTF